MRNPRPTIILPALLLAIAAALAAPQAARAHCQVPCGIYDDPARIQWLREDAATISKAIDRIRMLVDQDETPTNVNQTVRWIDTKEAHASHVIEVVSEYFLAQRVKPAGGEGGDREDYLQSLAEHHAVMVAAMKCKQDADPRTAARLAAAIEVLAHRYEKR